MAKFDKNISAIGKLEAYGSLQLQACRQKIKITCLLCCRLVFQNIQPEVEVEKMKKKRNAIMKNLCDELQFKWEEIPDVCLEDMFPLCKGCFKKVERLWKYNEEIKRIQEKSEATVLEIRRTVIDAEFSQPTIKNPNPLLVEAEAKRFKRLREMILNANRDALRNDSQNDDGLIDESSDRSEDMEIVTQNKGPIMTAMSSRVALVDSFNAVAALRIRCPSACQGNNSKGQNVTNKNCVFCAKSCPNRSTLMRHLLSHVREKPFSCIVCGKEFGHKGNLKTHIGTHTGERPFKCNLCFKTFIQKGSLRSHIGTHTGEKPFKCNLCFKTFNHKGSLRSHLRTHTGEKPFNCNLCFKTFNQKCNLLTHLAIHTGEKPYKCNLCFKTFNQKGNLGSHLRTHTRK